MSSNPLHVVFGAGPLGRAIAERLADGGARVRLVSRSGNPSLAGVEAVAADLQDRKAAMAAAHDGSVLYQCAAPAYQDWVRFFPNLQENAIAAAEASGAVLVAAENLYGYGVAGRLTEALPLSATTRKGALRAAMTRSLLKAHDDGRIRAVAGRASDFLGPGVRQSAIGERFWPGLIKGRPVDWFGDPDRAHTFTYLPDFADALVALGGAPDTWGRAWHVPSPETLSLRELADRASAVAGLPKARIRRTPKLLLRLVGLALPAAAEVIEMEYSYVNDFVSADDDWRRRFGTRATDWDTALRATVAGWIGDGKGANPTLPG